MKRKLNIAIKLLVSIVFLGVVGYQLWFEKDIALIWSTFLEKWNEGHSWQVILAVLLMPACWLVESYKWRDLMSVSLKLSISDSLKGVLSGVAISLFTPNRIGEYGGRILYVPARFNWRAVIATLVGSFAQNLVHITIGLGAFIAFMLWSPFLPDSFRTGLVIFAGLILMLGIGVYYNLNFFGGWMSQIVPPTWMRKPWRALQHLQKTERPVLTKALAYSLLKYVIFSTQFILLLMYFGVEVPMIWLLGGVAVMYLVQTGIPLPPFVDVVARSEVALILWAGFAVNELSVFAASLSIWIINLLIPSFFGLVAISSVNVLQSLGYETLEDSVSSSDNAVDRTASGLSDQR